MFGSKWYLENLSRLLKSMKKNHSEGSEANDGGGMSHLSSSMNNATSSSSAHNHTKLIAINRNFNSIMHKDRLKMMNCEKTEAEMILMKNKDRIKDERKRIISKLRC